MFLIGEFQIILRKHASIFAFQLSGIILFFFFFCVCVSMSFIIGIADSKEMKNEE